MAKYTPLAFECNLQSDGLVFDVGSLFEALCGLHDQRDARGVRYALATVLCYVVLAKLAGQGQSHGIAHWVKRRARALADFFGLAKPQAPHETTCTPLSGLAPKVTQDAISNTVMALVAVDPTDSQIIYVGVRGQAPPGGYWEPGKGALYRSYDGGMTFGCDLLPHNTDNNWEQSPLYSLAIDPTNRQRLYIGQNACNNIQPRLDDRHTQKEPPGKYRAALDSHVGDRCAIPTRDAQFAASA